MNKKYVFGSDPINYELFIQGALTSGEPVYSGYKPASKQDIEQFENEFDCSLSPEYKIFLENCNGGLANYDDVNGHIYADIKRTANGNDLFTAKSLVIYYFFTLDKQTLLNRFERDSQRESELVTFHLSSVQRIYLHDYVEVQEIASLQDKRFIYIADSHDYFIMLGCCGEFENQVLAIDTSLYPESPLDNVAVLADSFEEFLRSLYYEDY